MKKPLVKLVTAGMLCVTMATEPAMVFAEDFSAGFCSEESYELAEPVQEPEGTGEPEIVGEPEAAGEPEGAGESESVEEPEQGRAPGILTESGSTGELEIQGFSDETDVEAFCAEEEIQSIANFDEEVAAYSTASGTCGEDGADVKWSLENGVLTISGKGEMRSFYTLIDFWTGEELEEAAVPWEKWCDEIREVYVKKGVTSIGSYAFIDCINLKKAVLSDTVKCIYPGAFANDKNLTDLDLGNGVEEIYSRAFWGTGFRTLVLPSSLKYLEEGGSLGGMWNLENIVIKNNSTYSSEDGILYTDNGKTVFMCPAKKSGTWTISSKVTKIAEASFGYTNFSKITIPDTVKEIGDSAFCYSDKLTDLVFGKGTATIPYGCCEGDSVLKNVVIPEGVKKIESNAFYKCSSLKAVKVPKSISYIEEEAFESYTMVTFANPNAGLSEDGTYIDACEINVTGEERYTYAFEVLKLVNKERKKEGLDPLVMDKSLLESAMQRAFESAVYWSHTRPSGSGCFTIDPLMFGENIAYGQWSPETVMESWMNSEGHRANILTSWFTSIGIGCMKVGGTYYWVQCFGEEYESIAKASSYSDQKKTRTVRVAKDDKYYTPVISFSKTTLKTGETATVDVKWNNGRKNVPLENSGVIIKSSNTSVCKVKNGKITAVAPGSAKIAVYFPNYKEKAVTKWIKVSGYKATFNGNGGTSETAYKYVEVNEKIGTLPKASRAGYVFDGWYTAKSGGKKISTSTKLTGNKTYYAHWTKVSVSQASISKLTSTQAGKMTVTMKSMKNVSGYAVFYSTSSKFTNTTKKTTSKTSLTISGLKKNKTYYVKVRAYKKDSTGKNKYGAYSTVKKIKIKK